MAVSLNGSSQALSFTDSASLKATGSFTFMCWIRSTASAEQWIAQSYAETPNLAGWFLRLKAAASYRLSFVTGNNAGGISEVVGTTSLNDSAWHHVAAVRTASTNLAVFVDGVSENTAADQAPAYAGTSRPRIGCGNLTGANTNFFTGQIAHVKYWNGNALTAAQIQAEMRSTLPRFYFSNLKLWLPLDNAALPSTFPDFSQTGNTATPVNTPAMADGAPV